MNTNILQITLASALAACPALAAAKKPDGITLDLVGSYASGQYNAGAAEIVAHDPATQQLFVVNAATAGLDVLSIANIGSPGMKDPVKVASIDLHPFGAVANSVATRNGIIAIAVEAVVKTDPGKVVFYDTALNFLTSVTVGALPDMLTFTPNGQQILVANEGEPNNDYTIDPDGTVSIIDLTGRGGVKSLNQSNVRTVDFKKFNAATLDPSIRIFGLGQPPATTATVAADLEPEFITISQNSRTAWVTCQENNALAVIDIRTGTATKLIGLGFKDHAAVKASTVTHDLDPSLMPSIGTTAGGQSIALGGFSGLAFEGIDTTTGRYKFVAHTDRGPNAEPDPVTGKRPFLLPDFAPEVVRFELDRGTGSLTLTQRIALRRSSGAPLTGLPNTAIAGGTANTPYNDEVPVDLLGATLTLDPLGADLEGIAFVKADGSFWMCDEYRPALYHFNASGVLIRRVVPIGTAAAAGQPAGTFGEEWLPAVLAQRRQNRGFEGIAIDGGKIYAFVQSPLRNPANLSNPTLGGLRNIRVVEFNPAKNESRQFIYVMDNPNLGAAPNTRADKIGDAVSLGNGEFLVIERDDDKIPSDPLGTIEKKIYQFNLSGATPLTDAQSTGTIGATNKSVDQLTVAELVANSILPVEKVLYVDLNTAGYNTTEKVEGLAVIDPWTIAVVNDNDFGVAQITVNPDGTFTPAPGYVSEPTRLGIISVRHNALDASDRDGPGNAGKLNIRPWPVKGVYMPDGIASYQVSGRTFLITANEGDAREYTKLVPDAVDPTKLVSVDVLVEAVRAGSVTMDPAVFPNAAVLKDSDNLGRLNITNTMGRTTSGAYNQLFAFGARSFTIWNENGVPIYDSGDDLEQITSQAIPANFNASNSSNDFDNRSDDKGPEPEGVVIGKVFGREYAFIGLERIGGVVAYDVTNPRAPFFVDYINNRDFTKPTFLELDPPPLPPQPLRISNPAAGDLGPEGIIFIKPEDSPTGQPLIVLGNEISGTTSVFSITKGSN